MTGGKPLHVLFNTTSLLPELAFSLFSSLTLRTWLNVYRLRAVLLKSRHLQLARLCIRLVAVALGASRSTTGENLRPTRLP